MSSVFNDYDFIPWFKTLHQLFVHMLQWTRLSWYLESNFIEIFQLSLQQPLNLHKLATAQLLQHHCPHVSRNLSNCKAQEAPPWIHETIPTILRPHLLLLWSSDMNIDPFIYYWWINTPIMYTIITITTYYDDAIWYDVQWTMYDYVYLIHSGVYVPWVFS